MMKTIVFLFLCNIISINFINAQKCYICDQTGCDRPGDTDVHSCSDNADGGQSGKTFVNGALGKTGSNIYTTIGNDLTAHVTDLNLNTTVISWTSLTRWVCYVTKDKRRGCLIMGKGLCAGDKSWLGQISDVGSKITNIMKKATDAVGNMFADVKGVSLNDDQKKNISNWIAQNYMSKLVNNSNGAEFQLESCCEGDACNFASMIQKSTTVLSVLLLSIFILV